MTKQLPGGQGLRENEQYEKLLERLAGNQALKRFLTRRKEKVGIKIPIINPTRILAETANPSLFQKRWEQETADAKALLTIASQLQRDGDQLAAEALIRTLETDSPLPGEKEPITSMQTLTFVMPEAEKSLLLLRFLMYQYWDKWSPKHAPDVYAAFKTLTLAYCWHERFERRVKAELYDAAPGALMDVLKKYWHERWENSEGPDWSIAAEIIKFALLEIQEPYQKKLNALTPVGNPALGYYSIDLMSFGQFADVNFLFATDEPIKDVLKKFSRQEQEKMAFWTIQIPVYYWKYILGNGQAGNFTAMRRYLNDDQGKKMHLVLFPENLDTTQFQCGWDSFKATFGFGLWLGQQNYWKMKDRYYPTEGGIILAKDGNYQNSGPLVLETFLEYQAK